MHNLVELWALLGLCFSKIFDQVGGSEWSADVGLFNFEGPELGLRDLSLVPTTTRRQSLSPSSRPSKLNNPTSADHSLPPSWSKILLRKKASSALTSSPPPPLPPISPCPPSPHLVSDAQALRVETLDVATSCHWIHLVLVWELSVLTPELATRSWLWEAYFRFLVGHPRQ